MGRSPTGGGRRRPYRREQRRRFLIACEGDKEVAYFKWLSKRLGGAVVLKPMRHWAAPEHVLELAVREREADQQAARESGDPGDVYDGVWMVVDIDDYINLPKALAGAARVGVSSAVSGPCFEVWLILHLTDHAAAFTTSIAAKERWSKLIGATHQVEQEFTYTVGHLATAMARADKLLARLTRDAIPRYQRNPSTEVGVLVKAILNAGNLTSATL